MKRMIGVVVLLVLFPALAWAQPAGAAAQRAEMNKLQWLVGEWKGSGWIVIGPQGRKEFTQTETIQSKLDGLVILIEGIGKSKEDGSTVHSALALVSYDDRARTLRWRAFTAEGRQTDAQAKAGTNMLEWEMQIPRQGRIRYTLKLNEKGDWFEVGEMSQDGQTWNKFFEMTLQKQK
jgi:hypothetical protein